jgi:enoyl-CoA hydratase/carnithine racemase
VSLVEVEVEVEVERDGAIAVVLLNRPEAQSSSTRAS